MPWIETSNTKETVLVSSEDIEYISQFEWKECNWDMLLDIIGKMERQLTYIYI